MVIYYNITAFTVLLIIFTVSIGDLLQIHLKKNYIKVIKQKNIYKYDSAITIKKAN